MTERLFAVWPTPTERRELRGRNRRAQPSMFDVPELVTPAPVVCPACGGEGDACTCARTGAVALELVASCDDCGRAETCDCEAS